MQIIHGDCIVEMAKLAENSVDAIVTDPPYELSHDGKVSPNRVALEVMFPNNTKLQSMLNAPSELSFFISKISQLSNISVGISNSETGFVGDIKSSEYLGCFALKLTDSTHFLKVIDEVGSGFFSSGIGVGFRVSPASLPSLFSCLASIPLSDDDMGFRRISLSNLVSALSRATIQPMFTFSDLANTTSETFTADGARLFGAILLASGAEFVRADSTTGSLPPMFGSCRISVIDDAANRAFSFDLIIHTPNLTSIGFMGKSWDGSKIAFNIEVWKQALRVLKPGGHLLAFSGSRTYHRMASAIEDAGFEIRDQIQWIYGSGFPKSMNISKSIGDFPEAKQWQGWGTMLKPAHEPIVLARKPLNEKTVAANVLHYGTGGLNIDGTRVGSEGGGNSCAGGDSCKCKNKIFEGATKHPVRKPAHEPIGRFPANVIHDGSDDVVKLFPSNGDSGSASRFFYSAKTSKRDRNEGLDEFEEIQTTGGGGLTAELREDGSFETASAGGKFGSIKAKQQNIHPTVKPTDLMRYLCRLVTPPNGTVLDPFMGSGSTGKACMYEGFDFIGVELTDEYIPIAKARIEFAKNGKSLEQETLF